MRFKTVQPRPWAAGLLLVVAVASGCADKGGDATSGTSGGDSAVKVAVVYSKTGPLAAYGQQYLEGFKAGLDYATKGTGKAGTHPIEVTYADDAGDPAKATSSFKQYVGQGYKVIAGSVDSGIAGQLAPLAEQNKVLYVSGPAAADTLTGANSYTFRSGRQTYQDVATASTIIGEPKGAKVLVFAQDSTFGQGNVKAVSAVLGTKGATVTSLLVPPTATDFTPFAQQAAKAKADLVYVAWAGASTPTMWQAMDQQGVLKSTTVVTGLAGTASFPAYGPGASDINFLSHYFPQAATNPVNTAMTEAITKAGGKPDLFSPDGFVAAQMIVHAVEKAGADTSAMVKALEGWTFEAPKGSVTVRAGDHAMLQPMFQAKLALKGGVWTPSVARVVPADSTTPPQKG